MTADRDEKIDASAPRRRRRASSGQPRRTGLLLGVLASVAALAGCGNDAGATPGSANGPVNVRSSGQHAGRGDQGSPSSDAQNESAGSFTFAFARCMRAHGISNFPNPNGHGGQLGPNSGINPTSRNFQSAVNGPCRKLAPPAWASSGRVTR